MSSRGTSPAKEYIESHGSLSNDQESRVADLIAKRKAERGASPDKPAQSNAVLDGLGERGAGLSQVEHLLAKQNESAARLAASFDDFDPDADSESPPTSGKKKKKSKEKKRRSKEKDRKARDSAGSDSTDDGAALLGSPSPNNTPVKGRGFLGRSSKSPLSPASPQDYLDVRPTSAQSQVDEDTEPARLPASPTSPPTERTKLVLTKDEQKELGLRKSKQGCCNIL